MLETIKIVVNGAVTVVAMYFMYDLERCALAAGINGIQFGAVIAGIGLLGGVTLAPILDKINPLKKEDDQS